MENTQSDLCDDFLDKSEEELKFDPKEGNDQLSCLSAGDQASVSFTENPWDISIDSSNPSLRSQLETILFVGSDVEPTHVAMNGRQLIIHAVPTPRIVPRPYLVPRMANMYNICQFPCPQVIAQHQRHVAATPSPFQNNLDEMVTYLVNVPVQDQSPLLPQRDMEHRTNQQPTMQQSGIQHPGVQQQGMPQPDIQQLNMQQPNMQQSVMQQSGMQQPDIQQSDMQQPDIQQYNIPQPDIQQYNTSQPNMEQLGMPQPDIQQYNIPQSNIQQPGMQQYFMQELCMPEPGMQQHYMPHPYLQQPDIQQPHLQQSYFDMQPSEIDVSQPNMEEFCYETPEKRMRFNTE